MAEYNNKLQTNNTELQTILNTINNLPEAGSGGGGSIETCTVTYEINNRNPPIIVESYDLEVSYIDANQELRTETITLNNSITVMQGSIIVLTSAEVAITLWTTAGQVIKAAGIDTKCMFIAGAGSIYPN